jgi:hypothetical protein
VARAEREGGPVRMDEALTEEEEKLKAEHEQARLAEQARRANLRGKTQFKIVNVNPFDVLAISPRRERGWDIGKRLSEKQEAVLLRQGIDPSTMPYSQAKQLLNEIFRRWDGSLCSFRQAAILKKYGYDSNISREDAKKTIDTIAANGWRRAG